MVSVAIERRQLPDEGVELRGDGFQLRDKNGAAFSQRDLTPAPGDAVEVAEAVRELRPSARAKALEDPEPLRGIPEPLRQEGRPASCRRAF